ncbi:MAG: hypothetical protein H6607_04100 [Flavobacteriales bacterium]|nr:hypothetical protein [Flavobacteriales bacterium]
MKRLIILAVAVASFFCANAQSIMLKQDVNEDTVVSNFGRNRKHFYAGNVGFASIIGNTDNDSFSLKNAASWQFNAGVYYKYRVSQPYSLVFRLDYVFDKYKFKTDSSNVKYANLVMQTARLEFANRFNYGRRGNYLGRYLEIGISADYAYRNRFFTKTTAPDNSNYTSEKSILYGLKYIEPFNYSAHARLGFNKFVLTADYRLSDNTNNLVNYNLPPLAVGVLLDLGGF